MVLGSAWGAAVDRTKCNVMVLGSAWVTAVHHRGIYCSNVKSRKHFCMMVVDIVGKCLGVWLYLAHVMGETDTVLSY